MRETIAFSKLNAYSYIAEVIAVYVPKCADINSLLRNLRTRKEIKEKGEQAS